MFYWDYITIACKWSQRRSIPVISEQWFENFIQCLIFQSQHNILLHDTAIDCQGWKGYKELRHRFRKSLDKNMHFPKLSTNNFSQIHCLILCFCKKRVNVTKHGLVSAQIYKIFRFPLPFQQLIPVQRLSSEIPSSTITILLLRDMRKHIRILHKILIQSCYLYSGSNNPNPYVSL